jgi:hypothetical protein
MGYGGIPLLVGQFRGHPDIVKRPTVPVWQKLAIYATPILTEETTAELYVYDLQVRDVISLYQTTKTA